MVRDLAGKVKNWVIHIGKKKVYTAATLFVGIVAVTSGTGIYLSHRGHASAQNDIVAVETEVHTTRALETTVAETESETEEVTTEVIGNVQEVLSNYGDAYVYDMIMNTGTKQYLDSDSSFQEGAVKKSSASIGVSAILQNPELPTGCEITSLTTVLQYLGYSVSKETMADDYLPKCELGQGSFWSYFIGNPRSEYSYGCYAPPIVTAANSYLSNQGSEYSAYNISGSDFSALLNEVADGNPVLVWNTMYLEQSYLTAKWNIDGEEIQWRANEHCVVLTGYDINGGTVTIADPLRGTVNCNLSTFVSRYKDIQSQAVVVKKPNEEKETQPTTAPTQQPTTTASAPTQQPTQKPTTATTAPTQQPTTTATTSTSALSAQPVPTETTE